ncbi:MAG: IS110 family transposase [Candidatus Scalindua sediminis]|nr:IS110 family transposase [Candidatus Scalindua sediminis]
MKDIEAKKVRVINKETLIVTVDISKVTNVGYCRCPNGIDIKPFSFMNNFHGFNTFWDRIMKTRNTHDLKEIVVGFEPTGPYGEPLTNFMKKKKVKLIQINPMHTKRVKELEGNSPNKTDQKDPKVIADIIELGHALTVVQPEGPAAELRRLTHARERAMQRRTAIFNQLQDLVFVIFPEFSQVFKDVKTRSAIFLLENCPTPEDIIKYKLKNLTTTLRKVSRGKLGEERARELYAAAKMSIGAKEGRQSILFEIKEILSIIGATEHFVTGIEKEMSHHLGKIPYSRFILSIKGIGEITVAGLIGEVGDFRKYDTISEILKFSGLDLFEISSGRHKGQRRISKRGRSLMRKLLFFAAINIVRKGGIMHEYYQGCLTRGMLKMKALIAVSRKLLGVIFALVRDHSEYKENYTVEQELKKAA